MSKVLFCLLFLTRVALGDALGGHRGCYLRIDLRSGKVAESEGLDRALPPCSTFKVAVAAMAFDAGVLDRQRVFIWDGALDSRAEVNQNQTAETWMERSVVWVTQVLTRQLGLTTVKDYLARFDYGNEDFSGGLTRAWLCSSLLIDAHQQADFMRRLWLNQLPISAEAQSQTRGILVVQQSGPWKLIGKTGSGIWEGADLGRYVGVLQGPEGEFVVVLDFQGSCKGPGGLEARRLLQQHLRTQGLW